MRISISVFLREVKTALGVLAKHSMQSTKAWDLYEVLVFGAGVASAREIGTAKLLDAAGNRTNRYLFRSSPGPLARPAQQFTHAEIHLAGHPELEMHTGIWVLGKSQLPHECDCVVLLKAEADAVRAAGRAPLWGHVLMHVESKYYGPPIPFGHGRGFLGLSWDLGWHGSTLVINRDSVNAMALVRRSKKAAALRLAPGDKTDLAQLKRRFVKRFASYQNTGKV